MTTRRFSLLATTLATAAFALIGGVAHAADATPSTVVAATSANPDLTTFNKLVQQAGLNSTLEGNGPVTVFAPSDEAFKAVPAATMDNLIKDPEALKAVLSYHIVPAKLKSSDIDGTQSQATLNGAKLTVSKAGDFVTVDDGLVTKGDIASGNGVVHVIDRVLTPPKK